MSTFGKTALFLLLLPIALGAGAGLYLYLGDASRVERMAEQAKTAYAMRLRADGDLLACQGDWEGAFVRYEQAQKYDHGRWVDGEKDKIIREHVGEVMFDEAYSPKGTP